MTRNKEWRALGGHKSGHLLGNDAMRGLSTNLAAHSPILGGVKRINTVNTSDGASARSAGGELAKHKIIVYRLRVRDPTKTRRLDADDGTDLTVGDQDSPCV